MNKKIILGVLVGLMLFALPAMAMHQGKRHSDAGIGLYGCGKEYQLQLKNGAKYLGYSFDESRKYYNFPLLLKIKDGMVLIDVGGKGYQLQNNYKQIDINNDGKADTSMKVNLNFGGGALIGVKSIC